MSGVVGHAARGVDRHSRVPLGVRRGRPDRSCLFSGINVALSFIGGALRQERQALRKRHGRPAGVLAPAVDSVISVDANQRVVFYSPAAAQVFRFPVVSASAVNGGVYGDTNFWLYNLIIYSNSAATGSNYSGWPYGLPIWFNGCCTAPMRAYGDNPIVSDRLFVNLARGNLRRQANSPCVDAGLNWYASSAPNLDDSACLVGSTVDIGA